VVVGPVRKQPRATDAAPQAIYATQWTICSPPKNFSERHHHRCGIGCRIVNDKRSYWPGRIKKLIGVYDQYPVAGPWVYCSFKRSPRSCPKTPFMLHERRNIIRPAHNRAPHLLSDDGRLVGGLIVIEKMSVYKSSRIRKHVPEITPLLVAANRQGKASHFAPSVRFDQARP
jgi:hypothetical protein